MEGSLIDVYGLWSGLCGETFFVLFIALFAVSENSWIACPRVWTDCYFDIFAHFSYLRTHNAQMSQC